MKKLNEVKETYAKELGYKDWETCINDQPNYKVEALMDKVALRLYSVRFELPGTKEVETRLKHVIDESFEDYEEVAKREYSLGFRACYRWLKIKQIKSKVN